MRPACDEEPEHVLVLATLGAPERRRMRGRRGTAVRKAHPEPVPTSRVTLVRPPAFPGRTAAEEWLGRLRAGAGQRAEVDAAVSVVNRALHAYRAARADPYVRDVSADQALVVRLGFGSGDAVADGRYDAAWELPSGRREPARRSMEAPEERFAALVGGRDRALVCEELLLRARADLDAGRAREAALQARIALESLLAELDEGLGPDRRAALKADRARVAQAANLALSGELPAEHAKDVTDAVVAMEAILRARRLASSSTGADPGAG